MTTQTLQDVKNALLDIHGTICGKSCLTVPVTVVTCSRIAEILRLSEPDQVGTAQVLGQLMVKGVTIRQAGPIQTISITDAGLLAIVPDLVH